MFVWLNKLKRQLYKKDFNDDRKVMEQYVIGTVEQDSQAVATREARAATGLGYIFWAVIQY